MDKNKEVNQDEVIEDKKTIEEVMVENPTISLTPQVEGVANSVKTLMELSAYKDIAKISSHYNSQLSKMAIVLGESLSKASVVYNKAISPQTLKSIQAISESAKRIVETTQINYADIISGLGEIVQKILKPYKDEEFEDMKFNIEKTADKGWVVYYFVGNTFERLKSADISEIENEWVELLKRDLDNKDTIEKLSKCHWYSSYLIDSMYECYKCKNYYAAYTLATLAIDGAVNRIAEELSIEDGTSRKRNIVGYRAVKGIEDKIEKHSLTYFGLFKWLYNFFQYTEMFTLDEPNRHIIGHGRWDKEISELQFLKVFNTLLFISDRLLLEFDDVLIDY